MNQRAAIQRRGAANDPYKCAAALVRGVGGCSASRGPLLAGLALLLAAASGVVPAPDGSEALLCELVLEALWRVSGVSLPAGTTPDSDCGVLLESARASLNGLASVVGDGPRSGEAWVELDMARDELRVSSCLLSGDDTSHAASLPSSVGEEDDAGLPPPLLLR